jgi:transposase
MAEVVAQLEKQLGSERKELAYARLKIQALEEQLRQQRIAQYGPGSEKLSNLQLELLDEEPAVSRDEVQAESEREPAAPPPATSGKKQRTPHPGRNASAYCTTFQSCSF